MNTEGAIGRKGNGEVYGPKMKAEDVEAVAKCLNQTESRNSARHRVDASEIRRERLRQGVGR
jgi:hypothetical protein